MADLIELAERVERANGPDRRIDYEVFTTFAVRDAANFWNPKVGHEYTSSLDACVALLERVLPGWLWAAANFDGNGQANAYIAAGLHHATVDGVAPTPSRALLAAILRALSEKDR